MSTDAELVETARRIAAGGWTVGPEGAIELETNPALAELVQRGYARLHYTAAYKRTDDYWQLTPEGVQWLSDSDGEAADGSACGYSYDHTLRLIDTRDGISSYECRECGAEITNEEY